ncbi:MAG: 16S rRNA (cytosine(967)-C(5))-methyltransferase RsmB [Acidobacteriota bacterium]|nr:16S rRNA (cytosine(967)-C(5))-methyltransferase RsmB [Acidobacteriota bacterium]
MKKQERRGGGSRVVSPARRAAFEVLRRVEEEGAFAAPLLAGLPEEEMSAEDRGLCHALVLGVLRRQLWLDRLVEHFAGRASERLDAPVRRALRLGLYQLRLLTRVPARAAVNESVNLTYAARLRSAAPFVNAVLRRAAREPDYDPAAEIKDPLERIAVETSHPAWLVRRWASAFGSEEVESLARANNDPAPASFRVNTLRCESDPLIKRLRVAGVRVEPSRVAPDGWRAEGGACASNVSASAALRPDASAVLRADVSAMLRSLAGEGLIYLQDEASQLVAHVLGARAGERVLDVCAAPGSKTTHVAALAGDRALVVAGDLHGQRLRVVGESCERLGVRSVQTVALDAEEALPFAGETFERVLVDAPCTGTGTLRHNPEIRWRLTPASIGELASVQRRILAEAARVLKRGGRLVYSTCSVEREENEEVVAALLGSRADFEQVEAAPAPAPLLLPSGAARTWPHRDDVDGFFVAALRKQ